MTPQRVLAALALVFALAHVPFLATSLEDIDSVNFALGVRDFDVATTAAHWERVFEALADERGLAVGRAAPGRAGGNGAGGAGGAGGGGLRRG